MAAPRQVGESVIGGVSDEIGKSELIAVAVSLTFR
jgi:hypothetical protein